MGMDGTGWSVFNKSASAVSAGGPGGSFQGLGGVELVDGWEVGSMCGGVRSDCYR